MNIIGETERLILRELTLNDIDATMSFWGDQEVMKYCGGSFSDRTRLEKSIHRYIKSQREKGYSAFVVALKETNQVIGACGFNDTEDENVIELIYHFAKKHWGKGYATEAGKACIDYAKENLNIEKIIASIDPRHLSSKKVLEKLGFQFIGLKWFEDTEQEEPCFELVI